MTKLCFDRLPNIVTAQLGYNGEEIWQAMTESEQRQFLLNTHDSLLNINGQLVSLILEMEKAIYETKCVCTN